MANLPSSEELDSMFQQLKAVLTQPEFRQALEEALNVPTEQRAQALSTQLTPTALAARGVQLPESISISTDDVDTSSNTVGHTYGKGNETTRSTETIGIIRSQICWNIFGIQICFTPTHSPKVQY